MKVKLTTPTNAPNVKRGKLYERVTPLLPTTTAKIKPIPAMNPSQAAREKVVRRATVPKRKKGSRKRRQLLDASEYQPISRRRDTVRTPPRILGC
jgi:hypothetical protein